MVLGNMVIVEAGMRAGVVVIVVTDGSNMNNEVVVTGGSGMGPGVVFTGGSGISAESMGTFVDVDAGMGAEVMGTVVLGGSCRDDEAGGIVVTGGTDICGLCRGSWILLCILFK